MQNVLGAIGAGLGVCSGIMIVIINWDRFVNSTPIKRLATWTVRGWWKAKAP